MALTQDPTGTVFPQRRFSYSAKDTILYALGVGAGSQDQIADLPYLFEMGLRALPSQAAVIAWDDAWLGQIGLNERLVVHGEQRITLHQPLPVAAAIEAQSTIVEVVDKGQDRGALLYVETAITRTDEPAPLATLLSTVFARGDGGFGGKPSGGPTPHPIPSGSPDLLCATRIPLNQALIYRLSGDLNPLHADPDFARSAGFDRPILHGLSTYGATVRTITSAVLGYDPTPIEHIAARFSAPLFPGDDVEVLIWNNGLEISFRLVSKVTGKVVLDHGLIRLRA